MSPGRDRTPQSCPCWFPQRREKPSIHQLVERFLLGLQEEFPSTISTVYRYGRVHVGVLGVWGDWGAPTNPHFGCRTGEKLSPEPAKASSESQRCLLCLCGLDTEGGEWGQQWGAQGIWGAAEHPPVPPWLLQRRSWLWSPR